MSIFSSSEAASFAIKAYLYSSIAYSKRYYDVIASSNAYLRYISYRTSSDPMVFPSETIAAAF
jgi:hypothetical protein